VNEHERERGEIGKIKCEYFMLVGYAVNSCSRVHFIVAFDSYCLLLSEM